MGTIYKRENNLRTSVIIPSFNPQLKLSATLDTLLPQSSLIDELIIIIDNDTCTDFIKLLTIKYSTNLNIKVFPQANSGRAKSRNRGAELSTGDILIFLDDDMLAEKDLIKKHLQYHTENQNIIASGNGYRNPKDATSDFNKFLVKMENEWKEKSLDKGEISITNFNFTACNMSLPKTLFAKLGAFDTRLTDAEDFDFGVRALQKNVKIIYDRTLLAWHSDWPSIDTFIKRQNEYSEAKSKLLTIHPEYIKSFPSLEIKKSSYIKKASAKIIRTILGKQLIHTRWGERILPINLKFFLYRTIISSYSYINI